MSSEHTDVYANHPDEYYPGIRQRSRPGEAPKEEIYDKTKDAYGNIVTDKPSNRAILSSQRRRLEHESKLKAQQLKKQEQQRRASAKQSSDWTIRNILPILLFLPLLSLFLTQSFSFGLSPYFLPPLRRYWNEFPLNPFKIQLRTFTPQELLMYDGLREDRPVYLAVDGVVFDVSANRRIYGKGGSYNMMAGRDASRAFTTGCFETHLTHDTRGLNDDEQAALTHWKSFFLNHEKYHKIGYVLNPPLTEQDRIPEPCRVAEPESGSQGQHAPGEAAAKRGRHKPGPVQ
ncbi:hypothetical protein I302_103304 [Kwoniella bestiolae CBS 10118]|uniref:Cytochrome b5 heme-binding domain-containing protein n=1 Tax=Kwoniella bestiolae CBS 10118 TaxID=1296100 RepID=A0A1B9G817_9TREE|nr:hypothetical protein I302_02006 [Kwoniella bestiolae CBS 10118]OCF27169.1 hypothetical protein I302_02006 [Kwoniella bestiolae CBS 10118]